MPAEEGRRSNEEVDPAVPRENPAGRREEDPVHGPEPGRAGRAPQHLQLMAEDEDLEVLGAAVPVRSTSADEETDEGADGKVDERSHRPILPG